MPVSESHVLVGVHTFRREEYLVGPSFLKCRLWVISCLPECAGATAAVPQIAADLLHRASRQS
jgi:hypothetical protein